MHQARWAGVRNEHSMTRPRNWIVRAVQLLALMTVSAGISAVISAIVLGYSLEIITAASTVFLGLATAALAAYTAVLATESRAARLLADRHHQESQNPFLTLDGAVARHETTFQHSNREKPPQDDFPKWHDLFAKVTLLNAGYGAALRTKYRARFSQDGDEYWFPSENPDDWATTGTVAIASRAVLEARRTYGEEIHGFVERRTEPVATELIVRYYNVFGGEGELRLSYDSKGNYSATESQPMPVSRM